MLRTYDDLLNFITGTLARPSLRKPAADWLYIAELEAQRELDLPMHEKTVRGTLDANQDFIALPSDVANPRFVTILTDPPQGFRVGSFDDLARAASDPIPRDAPKVGAITGNRIRVEPLTTAHDFEIVYDSADIQHLSEDVPENYLTRVGADYLAYTALLHSVPYLGSDDRLQRWMLMQGRAEESMRRQAWRHRAGHGPLMMHSDRGHP